MSGYSQVQAPYTNLYVPLCTGVVEYKQYCGDKIFSTMTTLLNSSEQHALGAKWSPVLPPMYDYKY